VIALDVHVAGVRPRAQLPAFVLDVTAAGVHSEFRCRRSLWISLPAIALIPASNCLDSDKQLP